MIALVLSLFAIGLLTIGVTAFRVARRRRKAHFARETAWEELRTVEQLIGQAEDLLAGTEADFFRPFVDAMRAVARLADRARTEG